MSRESEIRIIIDDYEFCRGVNDSLTIGRLRSELNGILCERKRILDLCVRFGVEGRSLLDLYTELRLQDV